MPDKISFGDVGSDHEVSDSEAEYSDGEREVLQNIRRRQVKRTDDDEQEEAVLGFEDGDDDDDDDDAASDEPDFDDIRKFEHDSDIEEAGEEDDLPDRQAWGSKASAFYGTGYTDRDYDTLTAKEEELAQLEEAEALEIQKRLIQGMTAEDFQLDLLAPTEEEQPAAVELEVEERSKKKKHKLSSKKGKEMAEIVIKGDLSDLSAQQQRELFRKDAPEFDGLVNDFTTKLSDCAEMEPVLELLGKHDKLRHPFGQLLQRRYELSLLYCNNIIFYVLLKSQKANIRNHPLVKRLLQLKRLVQEVEQKYEQTIKPQVEELQVALADGEEITFPEDGVRKPATEKKATGRLKALERLEKARGAASDSQSEEDDDDGGFEEDSDMEESSAKRLKLGVNEDNSSDDNDDERQKEEDEAAGSGEDEEMEEGEGEGDAKRKITYQMAKNKGLTARKRKDQRNIRVKNKLKYRKALIRRKGAVRPVRKELTRYSGESSIKPFVKRSIKIK